METPACGGTRVTGFSPWACVESRQQRRGNFQAGAVSRACGMQASRGEGIEGLGNIIAELVQRLDWIRKEIKMAESLIN